MSSTPSQSKTTLPSVVAEKLPHIPESKEELKAELKAEAKAAASSGLSQLRSFVAGGFGGVCAVVVGHPFDLVKVRLQTAEKGVYSGAFDVVKKSVAKDGLRRGLYAGVSAPLVGVTPMCKFCPSFSRIPLLSFEQKEKKSLTPPPSSRRVLLGL
jgi:solute carrier family 25 carnitine/acylcarnitine transporter 20/29